MPNLFSVCGYKVYFWSHENNEPIHIHISKGAPQQNATKIWLTKSGGCVVANNNGHIPQNELNELLDIIAAQYFFICAQWKKHFIVKTINFYC